MVKGGDRNDGCDGGDSETTITKVKQRKGKILKRRRGEGAKKIL